MHLIILFQAFFRCYNAMAAKTSNFSSLFHPFLFQNMVNRMHPYMQHYSFYPMNLVNFNVVSIQDTHGYSSADTTLTSSGIQY